jgi:hypothetical protein
MSFWAKVRGTIEQAFQIGLGGPQWNNNGGVLEGKNAANSALAVVRGATAVGPTDLAQFSQLPVFLFVTNPTDLGGVPPTTPFLDLLSTTVTVPAGKNLTVQWTVYLNDQADDIPAVTSIVINYSLTINGVLYQVYDTLTVDGNENGSGLVTTSMQTVTGLSGSIVIDLQAIQKNNLGETIGDIGPGAVQFFITIW